jgi:hypothetical protein
VPGGGFFASLAAGLLIALAVPVLTWPLLRSTTRPDAVRLE